MFLFILKILIILTVAAAFPTFVHPAIVFFRLKYRMQELKKFALANNLVFEPGEQIDYKECQKIYYFFGIFRMRPDREINFIRGNYNGHTVNIYDLLFPGPKFSHHFVNGFRKTVIEIDGKYLRGKEREYQKFSLGDSYFTSIFELKKILSKL